MKIYKYTVYFFNGDEMDIYTTSLKNSAILATARAIENSKDQRIKCVYDHNDGQTYYPTIYITL